MRCAARATPPGHLSPGSCAFPEKLPAERRTSRGKRPSPSFCNRLRTRLLGPQPPTTPPQNLSRSNLFQHFKSGIRDAFRNR